MKYTESGELGELAKEEHRGKAVACLNEMITDALECVPECMQYMTMLKTEEVFRFCAIPQVTFLATCCACTKGNVLWCRQHYRIMRVAFLPRVIHRCKDNCQHSF